MVPTADVAVAFKDIDYAFLVGAMPRREGMERKDLLKANVKIFKDQGAALDKFANKDVRVLVSDSIMIRTISCHCCFIDSIGHKTIVESIRKFKTLILIYRSWEIQPTPTP